MTYRWIIFIINKCTWWFWTEDTLTKKFFFSWDQISSHFFQTYIFNFLSGGLGYLFLVWTWSNKTCKFSQGTDELDMKLRKWGSFFKPIFIFNEASFFLDVEFKFLSSLAIFSQGTDTTKHVKFPFQTNIHLISTRHPFLLATSQVFYLK
jgi:hypothetical protein